MNELDQAIATGGAGTLLSAVLFLLYKIFSGNRRIKSSCCGAETSLSISANPSDKNLAIRVVNDPDDSRRDETQEKNPRGRTGSTNERQVSQETGTAPQRDRGECKEYAREDSCP
jgi:hypothetical protein